MTRAQAQLLKYIGDYIEQSGNGVCPNYDEMKVFMGLRSKSGVHRLIVALEERGHIRRLPHRARSIEVVKTNDGCCPTCGQQVQSLAPAFAA